MAYTKDDLKKIEDAILQFAAGKRVSEIQFSDRKLKFEATSVEALNSLRDQIRADVVRTNRGRSRFLRIRNAGKGMR
ncbi:hypothetical protein [Chitinimonas lacunae]|uniref:GpW protein n=1 Tax=Chitinimonas lacunae TaxID=1963018 RepID=A0ABV8MKV1_9NEIS